MLFIEAETGNRYTIFTYSARMVEMESTEWSDLRQESPNEIEDPDIPDNDSTDAAVRLRNMANVSQS